MFPYPALSCFPPQIFGQLLDVTQRLLDAGHDGAAANLCLMAVSSPTPSLSPPSNHVCPLTFPPPLSPSPRKRCRRRRRSRRSPSPNSFMSAEVEDIVTSILDLPVKADTNAELMDSGIFEEMMAISKEDVKEEKLVNVKEELIDHALDMKLDKGASQAPMIGPYRAATKDELWLEEMLATIVELEPKYVPHPLPYEDADGYLHSADVKPYPQVDFHALGYHARRLPTPSAYPIQSCAQDAAFYESPPSSSPGGWQVPNQADWRTFPFGYLPGFYTTKGIIAVPSQLFGHAYGREHGGPLATWYMCAT